MGRLETLEELLPEAEDVEIDESLVLDLSGHESSELEVVGEGGSMPTPAMLSWARELQVGSWYMLDYRDRNEAVQLAWQGMRRQLTLFVSPQGRGVLFQQHRLAAFLQAGLLVAGAGRSAHGARDAQRAGQARRRPEPAAELGREPPAAVRRRSVDQPVFLVDEQLVEDQRVGLFAEAPEDHQDDDLQVFEVERAAGDRAGAVDHHLAHRRRQDAGRFEEGDEADRLFAEMLLLDRRVDANALLVLLADPRLGDGGDTVEPGQGVVDLFGFEADRGELSGQLLVPGHASGRQ